MAVTAATACFALLHTAKISPKNYLKIPYTECEERSDAERDAGRNGLWFDPERDPRHDDDQRRRDVGVEEMVAEAASQVEEDGQAREVACRVLDGAVGGVVLRDIKLRQLDLGAHHQRVRQIPQKHQVVGRV